MTANLMMLLFTVLGIGGGLASLKYSEALARFFRSGARTIYSEKSTKRVYTARNVRWAGGGYVAFGLLSFGILIWRLFNGYGFS